MMQETVKPGAPSAPGRALGRREFLRLTGGAALAAASASAAPVFAQAAPSAPAQTVPSAAAPARPNLVFVFADQWRAQAAGYAGDKNAHTPTIDRLAAESVNVANMVSVCPVCTPYRASLLTGRYPLGAGMFVNDRPLPDEAVTIAEVLAQAGYRTGYIGKWHLDGRGREAFTPPERRQGFEYWKALECTHNYNKSRYYEGADPAPKYWEGYDAIAQTRDAIGYIAARAREERPFCLFLSWGSPHSPYNTAPEKHRRMFADKELELRPNVPETEKQSAIVKLRGYYAHLAALDECVGELLAALDREGLARNTILVLTSDHGDMLGSQIGGTKLLPWDESACVPFLLRYPAALGEQGRVVDTPMCTPDIMPTLLALCGVEIPKTVEGTNFAATMRGERGAPDNDAALFLIPAPFVVPKGVTGWRAVRTRQHTYAENADGPWLLYDNRRDPYQLDNLCGKPASAALQAGLKQALQAKLAMTGDEFKDAAYYREQLGPVAARARQPPLRTGERRAPRRGPAASD